MERTVSNRSERIHFLLNVKTEIFKKETIDISGIITNH
jgi:hypothetical protein